VTAAVARQEGDPPAGQRPDDVDVARLAEWRLEPDLGQVGDALDLVEAAAADDPDRRARSVGWSLDGGSS
jgi:hypothetical protein